MRVWSFSLLAVLCVAPLACDKAPEGGAGPASSSTATAKASVVASTSATAPASASASAAAAPKDKHRFRGNGPLAMMFRSARSLTLKDGQKTKLEDLEKGLRAGMGPSEEMKTLNADITAGIKAGKLDDAKLKADQEAVEKVMKAHLDKDAEAFNALHAALEPEQRKALVANVREQMKKRAEKMEKWKDKGGPGGPGGPDGKPGHGPGKMGPGGPGAHGGPGGGGMFGLGRLTKQLDLDADQQKKVEAILPKPDPKMGAHMEEMKKTMDAMLDAFEKDGFDAKKFSPYDGKMAMPDHGAMDTKFLSQLLPILKPEQREKLADRMGKHGGGKGHGGPKMGHPAPSASGSAAPEGDDDDDDDDDKK